MRGGRQQRRKAPRFLRGAASAAIAAAILGATLISPATASAAGVKNADPYWFEDSYRTTSYVNLPATSAIVDTAGSGTAYLPPLSADAITYAPAYVGADIFEVGTATGVQGWGFNGAGLVREPFLDVPVSQPSGVSFLGQPPPGASSLGVRLAVASSNGVGIYAWNGADWGAAVSIPASGVIGVAAGADGGVLALTAGGFTLYAPDGKQAATVTGLSGLRGIASAAGGSLAAVWTAEGAAFYAWDGAAYTALPSWQEPTPSGGTLVSVAFFRGGAGFWLVTPTQAVAYGWDGTALLPLHGWDSTDTPSTLVAAAPGWEDTPGGLALLSAAGVSYQDAPAGALAADDARSLSGQAWAVFAPSAALQSVVLPVGHDMDEVKMVDTMAAMPTGTTLTYNVSTNGGAGWTATPPDTPTDVPSGSQLVYQAVLGTSEQTQTPVLDETQVFEIASEVTDEAQAVSWLLP